MSDPATIIGTPLFGGYRISHKIGAGGMGEVYLVENAELKKKLAIKVLLPERLSSSEATKRFLAEARAASAINHRNIIEIIDSSTLEDGRHYILMEYLEGTTLRKFARGIEVSLEVTLAILGQCCAGLQAAHNRGIVHRDLKPSNIYIAPQPDNPYFTKILDFGIAKLEDPDLAQDVQTKSQTVAGTPNYMSPEQARALRDVDHRTDLYALGVITYELLTGRPPYKARSVGDLVYQQASTTPPRPSELRPDLPLAWDELIRRTMSFDPDVRPQSARELAQLMIDATPQGEGIARATASLLFAPPTSDSVRPSASVSVPVSDWSQSSMPAGPVPTASVPPDSITASTSSTAAASPAALGLKGSGSHKALVSPQLSVTASIPMPHGNDQAAENPTTLGMSASQLHTLADKPKRGMGLGIVVGIGLAMTVTILVLTVGSGPGVGGENTPRPASPAITPVDTPSLPPTERANPQTTNLPTVNKLAIDVVDQEDADSEIDAGLADEATVVAKRPRKPRSPSAKKGPKGKPPVEDGDTNKATDPDDLFDHRK